MSLFWHNSTYAAYIWDILANADAFAMTSDDHETKITASIFAETSLVMETMIFVIPFRDIYRGGIRVSKGRMESL